MGKGAPHSAMILLSASSFMPGEFPTQHFISPSPFFVRTIPIVSPLKLVNHIESMTMFISLSEYFGADFRILFRVAVAVSFRGGDIAVPGQVLGGFQITGLAKDHGNEIMPKFVGSDLGVVFIIAQ